MASSETDWSDTALGVLRDFVDFRDRSGSGAPARCPLLPLWEAFVGHAPATPFPLPRKECRLERSMKFLEKQVAGSFSLVVDYLNTTGEQSLREYLAKLYLKGRDRRATRQERVLIPADFNGMLVADRFGTYDTKALVNVKHQKCVAHLLKNLIVDSREAQTWSQSRVCAGVTGGVQAIVTVAFKIRDWRY